MSFHRNLTPSKQPAGVQNEACYKFKFIFFLVYIVVAKAHPGERTLS